jgi:hypothetical protein
MSYQDVSDIAFAIGMASGKYGHPLSLTRHQAQMYSQNGEDGIIAEIFRRIGSRDRFFVEIGVEDGLQNNTRFLLETGWRGVWIDRPGEALDRLRETFVDRISSGDLALVERIVTAENVTPLLDQASVPDCVDLLSIDIDMNTSHVWRAINRRARVACIEYNASIPASIAVEVAYDPAATWDETNWFGAGLKALEYIGASKGSALVGCDLIGANAFFVSADEALGRFQEPFTAEQHWEPARYSLVGHTGHRASVTARRWSRTHNQTTPACT